MTIGRLAWIIGAAVLVLVINVVVSLIVIETNVFLINPGRDDAYYQEYAETVAPYSSIIAGVPLMFLMCRRVGGWWEADFAIKAAILVWLVYAVIDVLVLLGAVMSVGVPTRMIVLTAISVTTKFAAAYFGGIVGSRRVQKGYA